MDILEDRLSIALETWQKELSRLLDNPDAEDQAAGGAARRRFYFSLQSCMEVDQNSGKVGFMKLPRNTILNIPIVASLVSQVPLDDDNNFFEIELSKLPEDESCSVVIGLVGKKFCAGEKPGMTKKSLGLHLNDLSLWKTGTHTADVTLKNKLSVGDRVGCGIEKKDEALSVYFTHNGNRIWEDIIAEVCQYPAISLTNQQDSVKLLTETAWRSKRNEKPTAGKDTMKVNKATGQLTFRSTVKKNDQVKPRSCTVLASRPFSSTFTFFEIEIIGLGKGDEIVVGAVAHDHPHNRLPGSMHAMSVGYRACRAAIWVGDGDRGAKKRSRAPEASVGDKIGCGMEQRSGDNWVIYFTHNSETFYETLVNAHIRAELFPAVGLKSSGGSAVCVCIQDVTHWLDSEGLEEDEDSKASHVNMQAVTQAPLVEIKVNEESARASFQSELGVIADALLISNHAFSKSKPEHFEIEIAYGTHITVGVVTDKFERKSHPGFAEGSIGYNIGEGLIYIDGRVSEAAQQKKLTSNYGDRIRCGIRGSGKGEGKIIVYFEKNGELVSEAELPTVEAADQQHQLFAAVGMRSAGQQLSVRLLDRELWDCQPAKQRTSSLSCYNDDLVSPGKEKKMTSVQAEDFVKKLDRELLECPICREMFDDPRIFPCSAHSFCSGCLVEYVGMKKSAACPVCRKNCIIPPGGPKKLPGNQHLTMLIEIYKASGRN